MAVETTNTYDGPLYPNGVTTSFPFTFKALTDGEVSVLQLEDGVWSEVSAASYSVSLNSGAGGTVTFSSAPANGPALYIFSEPLFTQSATFTNQGAFLPSVLNLLHDRAALRDQWLKERVDAVYPVDFRLSADRAGKYLAWDAEGNPTPSSGTGADAGLRTDLAAPTGSSFVNFLPAGTGAVARMLEDELRDRISVKQFGATGDGTTDDSAAFLAAAQAASAAGGGRIEIPRGTYVIQNAALAGLSNLEWVGTGATIKGPASRVKSYFDASGGTNITFRGLAFDQLAGALPTFTSADYAGGPLNVPIYVKGSGSGVHVYDCTFSDLYTTAVYFDTASGLTVRDCRFASEVQAQNQWAQHIHCQTATDVAISGNQFVNASTTDPDYGACAIYASGVRRIAIRDNHLDYCGRNNAGTHRTGGMDFYGDVTDVFVLDNVLTNCMAEAIRLNACFGGKISGNRFQVNANAENAGNTLSITGSIIFGQNKGQRDIEISGNRFEDPSSRAACTVVIVSYDWGAPSRKIRVFDNIYSGSQNPVRIIGPFDRISIEREIADSGRSNIVVLNGTGMTSVEGTEANALYAGLVIRGNRLNDNSSDNANAVNVSLIDATTATVGSVIVEDNVLRASAGSTAPAVLLRLNSTNKANSRSYTRRNEIRGYATGVSIENHGEAVVENNRMVSITTPISETGMTVPAHRRGNRLSAGPMQGRATLVAGVADVSTAEVIASDRILLQRVSGATAVGFLVVESISAGSGFQVRAKDATGTLVTGDTGTFDWTIEH